MTDCQIFQVACPALILALIGSWGLFFFIWAFTHKPSQPKQTVSHSDNDWVLPDNWRN